MPAFVRSIDRASDILGHVAAWMFVAIGLMVSYDVTMRYVFTAPTKWALEISEFFLLWATYLAAASVLRHRENIRITLLYDVVGPLGRRLFDTVSLTIIAVFSGVAVVHGIDVLVDSVEQGRRTSTMLQVPKWMTELSIPVGFALLLAQALIELARAWTGEAPRPVGHQTETGDSLEDAGGRGDGEGRS
ncbi:TRAP transporter small permease [Roseospira navarrensis]|uniref:TRAP transporter small permease protein n=1 Tax=Roseospira navarrensis TaxID=140058 RepID=A0A7X2D354_9PROT|nr:TRAP transporter small permease [Roseospira navarrensis]MQX36969.1 TRAP transporter small permease subunit [Roseospira navarrensis]